MSKVTTFLRNWTLPISMLSGVVAYFLFMELPLTTEQQDGTYHFVSNNLQPVLLFCMLFLSFTKVRPREMRPRRWHLWVLLMQAGCFLICSELAMLCGDNTQEEREEAINRLVSENSAERERCNGFDVFHNSVFWQTS